MGGQLTTVRLFRVLAVSLSRPTKMASACRGRGGHRAAKGRSPTIEGHGQTAVLAAFLLSKRRRRGGK